jgi:hypothetical protein
MFGFLRKRREHPRHRELRGLRSCLVAWRRAVLEAHHRDGAADNETLEEKRLALAWYAHAAGGADPFTSHILQVPVGELDEPLYLDALYRIETAVGVAWTLGLIETLPPTEVGADFEALSGLFPLEGSPAPSIRAATLRGQTEILNELAEWKMLTVSARKKRDESPGESTAISFSRAYERARGLAWVASDTPWIEDTAMDV